MWPDKRNPEELEPEEPLQTEDLVVEELPDSPKTERRGSIRRTSESNEAFQRRTRTELDLIQRNKKGIEIKKQKAEEERIRMEQLKEEKLQKARALREKQKEHAKRSRNKKRKKKKKKVVAASDCSLGDVVLAQKGIAVVRWTGTLHFRQNDSEWAGIEFMDEPLGKNDGSIKGQRYFHTKPSHGSFVKAVKKKLAPEDILKKLGVVKSQLHQNENELSKIRDQMEQMELLMEEQEEELANFDHMNVPDETDEDKKMRESQHLSLKNTRSLVKDISASFDNLANNPVTETTLRIIDAYDYSSSEDEYDFEIESEESDLEEEVEALPEVRNDRKKLVDLKESDMYSQGSLKRMEVEMRAQMESLKKAAASDRNPAPMKGFKGLGRQKTFAGTQNLGIELPESNSTTAEVSEWVKANCFKLPNCPDLESEQVLSALVWATRALGHLHEHHSY